MLLIGLAGFALVAILASTLRDTILAWNPWGHGRLLQLEDLGYEGPSYVARGFMALGIGALVGAALRRPALALGVSAVLVFAVTAGGARGIQGEVAQANATWIDISQRDDGPGIASLAYVAGGYQDAGGRFVDRQAEEARYRESCIGCTEDDIDAWLERSFHLAYAVALPDTYSIFFAVDVALALLLGGACLVLTFPVALFRRRRAV
jgi:hypothetical protein